MSDNNISNIDALGQLDNLRILLIYDNNVENIDALGKLPELRTLELDCHNINDISICPFSDDEPLPIGRPMRNTEILMLDDQDRLVTESDIVGELCVRGTCLTGGYYNDPERTAAFVQNPLQKAYEEKIYRTGDLVKYNEQHELVYLSRKDFQIKHLGHRIELGEIETAASLLDGVAACCCLYNHTYDFIVLFLEGKVYTTNEVNEKLSVLLPRYILPSVVICLDSLPLNANGKIDRVKLKEKYIE